MWKRDEAVRPASGQPAAAPQPPAPAPAASACVLVPSASHHMEKDIVNIGKSVVIKGELNGSEDLTIEGHVEGTIQLREHVLTIGPNGTHQGPGVREVGHRARRSHRQRDGQRQGGHPRQRLGRRRHHLAARRDCRRRALPRQRRHAAQERLPPAGSRPSRDRPRPAGRAAAGAAGGCSPPACTGSSNAPERSGHQLMQVTARFDLVASWVCSIASRRARRDSGADAGRSSRRRSPSPVFATKALRKFLTALTARESPVLLDLGPVVGSNVSFFGEQLGCKIFVEDIFADLDRHVRARQARRRCRRSSSIAFRSSPDGGRHPLLGHHRLPRSSRRRRRWPSS